jgi:dipeptidyl aminopeptidase/acylaminoacyl peptidase
MGVDLAQLLSVPVYRALDADESGRVLMATDESGSMQLVEIDLDGTASPLTSLPGPCGGRYLPGQRSVIVVHDDGGDERAQLSTLDIGKGETAGLDDLCALIHDPRYIHYLAVVDRERLCYAINRRNGVDFDVIVRDLATGVETVGYDGGGNIGDVALSADGRKLAVTVAAKPALSDQILIIDLSGPAGDHTRQELTVHDEAARNERLDWTPAADALYVTSNRGRDFTGIARVDVARNDWHWLVTDDHHDVTGWLSPDGRTLLVETNVDGTSRVSLHDAATGAHRVDVVLPATGCIYGMPLPSPSWSPEGGTVVASFTGAAVPGDALRIDAATGQVSALTRSVRPIEDLDLTAPESRRIPTADGEHVPCLVYPGGAASVLFIHGGPESQAKVMFNPIVEALRRSAARLRR